MWDSNIPERFGSPWIDDLPLSPYLTSFNRKHSRSPSRKELCNEYNEKINHIADTLSAFSSPIDRSKCISKVDGEIDWSNHRVFGYTISTPFTHALQIENPCG